MSQDRCHPLDTPTRAHTPSKESTSFSAPTAHLTPLAGLNSNDAISRIQNPGAMITTFGFFGGRPQACHPYIFLQCSGAGAGLLVFGECPSLVCYIYSYIQFVATVHHGTLRNDGPFLPVARWYRGSYRIWSTKSTFFLSKSGVVQSRTVITYQPSVEICARNRVCLIALTELTN